VKSALQRLKGARPASLDRYYFSVENERPFHATRERE
jgi:hypothetical protein